MCVVLTVLDVPYVLLIHEQKTFVPIYSWLLVTYVLRPGAIPEPGANFGSGLKV